MLHGTRYMAPRQRPASLAGRRSCSCSTTGMYENVSNHMSKSESRNVKLRNAYIFISCLKCSLNVRFDICMLALENQITGKYQHFQAILKPIQVQLLPVRVKLQPTGVKL